MQFQVPQFIETEDKVVGPFSIRQFLYVGVAAILSAIFYFFVTTWVFVIAALVFMGSGIALSFVKINGRPLMKIAEAAFNFYWKPQMYVWKPEGPTTQEQHTPTRPSGFSLEDMVAGMALHKSWENLQTGTPAPAPGPKLPERKIVEQRMNQRYQVVQRLAGDRQAAKRVDYR